MGLHWMRIGTGLSSTTPVTVSEDFTVDAPLPVVGMHTEWEMFRKLWLLASGELLYVEIPEVGSLDSLKGLLTDVRASVELRPWKHVGLGLGYNLFYLNATVEKDVLMLSADYT